MLCSGLYFSCLECGEEFFVSRRDIEAEEEDIEMFCPNCGTPQWKDTGPLKEHMVHIDEERMDIAEHGPFGAFD